MKTTINADLIKPNINSMYKGYYKLNFDIHYKPVMIAGGDFYDILVISKNYYRIFIANAIGCGIQSGLISMLIKTEYDKIKNLNISPGQIMDKLNKSFYSFYSGEYSNLNIFFPCFLIDININSKELIYSSAGHPDQYLITKNNIITLQSGGKVIGVNENVKFEVKKNIFSTESKLILFTDGIFKQFSLEEKEYGEQRLYDIIKKNRIKNVNKINNFILSDLDKWIIGCSYCDDITLIGIEKL